MNLALSSYNGMDGITLHNSSDIIIVSTKLRHKLKLFVYYAIISIDAKT